MVKADASGTDGNGSADVEPMVAPPAVAALVRRDTAAEPRPAAPIMAAPADNTPTDKAAVNGDQRRTLHLALGNGGANGSANGNGSHAQAPRNGNGHNTEPPARPSFEVPRSLQPQVAGNGNGGGNGQRPFQAPRNSPPFDAGRGARDLFALPEGRPAAQQPRDAEAARNGNGNGNFIDQELRSRVDGDIAAFLAAFDAALASDTHESRFGLREATDRLLRAGARTRIELERLEARVPLPSSRDGGAEPEPAGWRYR